MTIKHVSVYTLAAVLSGAFIAQSAVAQTTLRFPATVQGVCALTGGSGTLELSENGKQLKASGANRADLTVSANVDTTITNSAPSSFTAAPSGATISSVAYAFSGVNVDPKYRAGSTLNQATYDVSKGSRTLKYEVTLTSATIFPSGEYTYTLAVTCAPDTSDGS